MSKKRIEKRLDQLFIELKKAENATDSLPISTKPDHIETGLHIDESIPSHTKVEKKPPFTRTDIAPQIETITDYPNSELNTNFAFPIQMESNNWGVLEIADPIDKRSWSPDEQMLVKQVVDQLSLAMQNAYLFKQTEHQASELAILNEMAHDLSSLLDINGVVETVYQHTTRLMDTTNFFVALFDSKDEQISFPLVINEGGRVSAPNRQLGSGLTDYVLRTRKPLLMTEDIPSHMKELGIEFVSLGNDTPSLCWIGVPLVIGDRVLGAIALQSITTPKLYNEHDLELLKTIASQAVIAIENARLFKQTQSRAEELATLNELGRALASELSLDQIIKEVHSGVSRLIDTTNFYIGLYDKAKDEVHIVLNATESEIDRNILVLPADQGITGFIIQTRESVFIKEGVTSWLNEHGMAQIGETAQSWLGVPITLGSNVLGVMAVQNYHKKNAYDEHDRNLLFAIANQAAIAIQNAQLFKTIQDRAEETASINRIIATVSGFLDIETSMEMVAEEVLQLLAACNVSIWFTEKDILNLITCIPAKLKDLPVSIRIPQAKNNPLIKQIVENHTPFFSNQISDVKSSELSQLIMAAPKTQSIYLVPILLGFDVLGLILVEFSESEYLLTERATRLLQTISLQIATAIQKVRLYEETNSSREQLADALRIGRMGYFEYDLASGIMTITNEMFALVDTSAEKEGGNKFPLRSILREFVISEDIHSILAYIQNLMKHPEKGTLSQEVRFKSRSGKTIWVENIYTITTNETGEYQKIIGSSQDITERKLAEEQLLKFKLGIENTDSAVFITAIDGTIQYVNSGFTKVYGYTAEEALGCTPRIIKSGLIPPDQYESFWHTLLEKRTISGELINKNKDGRLIPVAATNSPILNERGDIIGFLAVHSDITERKRFEETLQQQNEYLSISTEIARLITSTLDRDLLFGRAVDLIRDRFHFYHVGIFIIDDGGLKAILESATGDAGAEMKQRNHFLMVGSQSIVGKVSETGESLVVNNTSLNPVHKENPLLPDTRAELAIPLRVGSRIIGVIDIQSTKTDTFSENDVSILQSLADQIAIAIDNARSYELAQQAVEEMRELDRIKSQFLANMSHELRTPLNSIIGFSRVILKGIDGPITDLQKQDLNAIYNSGQHLLRLINDILDLSKIEAGKMELAFDDVNLAETIISVIPTITGLIKDKPIKLRQAISEELPIVRADPMRLRQVLINLLSNAAKFAEEGEIFIEAGIKQNSSGMEEIVVSVSDTGPGISPEDQTKLFQPFSQVDASLTRKTGGTGLGLSISRHLVEMHGGHIGLHSLLGQGSTFYFTLPLPKQKEIISQFEQISNEHVVLLIQHNEKVIDLYDRYLQNKGYNLVPLTDSSQAVDYAEKYKPFAIVLDIMMPGKDSWLVMRDLKSNTGTMNIPIIVCSNLMDDDKGFCLGATDFLVKPILERNLLNSLGRFLGEGGIRDVLIIDNDIDNLQLIIKTLNESTKLRITLAEGGQQGWEVLSSNLPHAVIMSLSIPDLDGFTILGRLRTNPLSRDIPVIAMIDEEVSQEQDNELIQFKQNFFIRGGLKNDEVLPMLEKTLDRLLVGKGLESNGI